jgi:hypothetical protein
MNSNAARASYAHISIRNSQSKKACRLPSVFWSKKCGPRLLQRPRERGRLRTDAGYIGIVG